VFRLKAKIDHALELIYALGQKENRAQLMKTPGLFSIIADSIREERQYQRRQRGLAEGRKYLERGDPAAMERFARSPDSVGDAWLALAEFYVAHRREDAALATEAYGSMTQSVVWIERNHRADDEYDRRRFLGIGATPDFSALTEEWKNRPVTGYGCEMRLAWIFACGPMQTRDRLEAWLWVALGEARWGDTCYETELPTLSSAALREYLVKSISEKKRRRLQEIAKNWAHDEFIMMR